MFVADFSLGDALLSILFIMLWIVWIYLVITIFVDIFRSEDLSGWAKALWVLFVIFLPFLGVLVYLIARGDKMQQRAMETAAQQEKATRQYIQDVSGGSTADELAKLKSLHDNGTLSDAEYQAAKAKALGS